MSKDLGAHCEHEGERQALASLPMLTWQTWKSSFFTLSQLEVKPMLSASHGSAEPHAELQTLVLASPDAVKSITSLLLYFHFICAHPTCNTVDLPPTPTPPWKESQAINKCEWYQQCHSGEGLCPQRRTM